MGDAPGTALFMYEIPSLTNQNITDAYNKVVADNIVDTLNSSFGGCEADVGKSAETWSMLAEQGAAKGITFHASSGDSGGRMCANAPASSPYVVAVGGTSLIVGSDGARSLENAWALSGSGVSNKFALPSWQANVPGVLGQGRNVPDVSLDANVYTGMALDYQGTWDNEYNPIGGTSLSSPIFGAAITEIDAVKNSRMGAGADALFTVWRTNGYGPATTPFFYDIVQGNDGLFFAEPGYDLASGIGSIDAWNIAELP